jgi:hypothetical protein
MLAILVLSSAAHADPDKAVVRPASVALPSGKVQVALTFEIESTADKLGKPVMAAPDVSYGVNDRLTVSLIHSKFGVTGFRAVTGGGLCLGGECVHRYNNAGAEALYALRTGPIAIGAIAGVHAMDFDLGKYDAKLGVRARYALGAKAALVASPSVLVAMTKRTDAMDVRTNPDLYYVPILATYKVLPKLTAGIGSGIKGSFEKAAATWELPLGFIATYAIERRVSLGASFVFGKLVGGADATGSDFRGTELWVVVTP